ncbi:UPF0746 protein DDB_G0281095-like [Frankliniella occidentalis]|uniref:UPF0746 protein DDB_G0281095-like n=1 Tax=Frankliniella occidentalis TaxID=133901 RepID=A0A9C6X0G6_FRAOC|nr:UPF0746 protein DDB_G0281095-like [Frankliniella occidentalis]
MHRQQQEHHHQQSRQEHHQQMRQEHHQQMRQEHHQQSRQEHQQQMRQEHHQQMRQESHQQMRQEQQMRQQVVQSQQQQQQQQMRQEQQMRQQVVQSQQQQQQQQHQRRSWSSSIQQDQLRIGGSIIGQQIESRVTPVAGMSSASINQRTMVSRRSNASNISSILADSSTTSSSSMRVTSLYKSEFEPRVVGPCPAARLAGAADPSPFKHTRDTKAHKFFLPTVSN